MKTMFQSLQVLAHTLFIISSILLFPSYSLAQKNNPESKKATTSKDEKVRIFMLCDMEGASGLFTKDQAWYWNQGVDKKVADQACLLLTEDVNAMAKAALEAGVDELIICDTHHGGNNIIPEKLISDPRIKFLPVSIGIQNGIRRWMPYLDESVDGFMLTGHHAKAGTEGAFLHHTQMGAWADFRINDQSVGEMGLESFYAGHWNIPVIFAQSDEAGCREAEDQFPGVITVATKRAESYGLAIGPDAIRARELSAAGVKKAIGKLTSGGKFTVFRTSLPATITIRMKTTEDAERIAKRPGIKKFDPYTIGAVIEQQSDILKWIDGTGINMKTE